MKELEKINLKYKAIYSLLHILSALIFISFMMTYSLVSVSLACLMVVVYIITTCLHNGAKDYIENKNKFS